LGLPLRRTVVGEYWLERRGAYQPPLIQNFGLGKKKKKKKKNKSGLTTFYATPTPRGKTETPCS
jgi:hypothetical protein